jgi:RNA polymerase sigma-70 factor (ECF subfamily)
MAPQRIEAGSDQPGAPEDLTLSTLVEQYERIVFQVALRIVHNREDAEDICQEVWLKVARSLPNLRDRSRILPWLCRISHNCALSFVSAHRARLQALAYAPEDDVVAAVPGPTADEPEQQAMASAIIANLRAALMTLAERDRKVLILREFKGLPYAEIGEVLKISTGNAEVSVHRARARLRARMAAGSTG